MKQFILKSAITLLPIFALPEASAHCQVPCGIYADDTVFATLLTDQLTIEKAMQQITELSKDPQTNANQIARWVTNKEQHAQNIQDVVARYFLTQRLKIDETDKNLYLKKLTQLHEITVYAMLCKQTTDSSNAEKLKHAITAFQATYSGKDLKDAHGATHSHSHEKK